MRAASRGAAERRQSLATAEGRGFNSPRAVSRGSGERFFRRSAVHRSLYPTHGLRPWLSSDAAPRLGLKDSGQFCPTRTQNAQEKVIPERASGFITTDPTPFLDPAIDFLRPRGSLDRRGRSRHGCRACRTRIETGAGKTAPARKRTQRSSCDCRGSNEDREADKTRSGPARLSSNPALPNRKGKGTQEAQKALEFRSQTQPLCLFVPLVFLSPSRYRPARMLSPPLIVHCPADGSTCSLSTTPFLTIMANR
jgi:hypothetical protein